MAHSNAKAEKVLTAIFIAGMFLCIERTMRDLFLWNCAYRMQTMNTVLSVASTLLVYIVFMFYFAKYGFNLNMGIIIPFCIIYGFYFISSYIHADSGVLSRCADSFIFALGPLLMLAVAAFDFDHWKRFISVVTWVFIAVAFFNILFIVFPKLYYVISDWSQLYFIGYKTFLVFPLVFGVMFSMLDSHYSGKKLKLIIYFVLFFINQIMVKAAGGLIAAVIIFLYLIPPIRRFFEKTDLAIFISAIIVLFAALMFLAEPIVNFAPVKHFIEDVLHRDLTLTGRLIIWPGVFEDFLKQPLLGYGISENGSIFYDTVYNAKWMKVDGVWLHAHNEFLQTLYEGGILTLLAGFGMLFFAAAKIRKCDDKRLCGILKMIVFTILIVLLDDQIVYYPWYTSAFVCQTALMCCKNRLPEG